MQDIDSFNCLDVLQVLCRDYKFVWSVKFIRLSSFNSSFIDFHKIKIKTPSFILSIAVWKPYIKWKCKDLTRLLFCKQGWCSLAYSIKFTTSNNDIVSRGVGPRACKWKFGFPLNFLPPVSSKTKSPLRRLSLFWSQLIVKSDWPLYYEVKSPLHIIYLR